MPSPYRRETIENWVGDFCQTDALAEASTELRAHAPSLLVAFLEAACERRRVDPGDVEEEDLAVGMLEGLARLDVPAAVREEVPGLCGDLLRYLESAGRLSGGGQLASYVQALGPKYSELASGKTEPLRRPGSKLGRNDPCPCGSGKKYKKCCLRG